MIVSPNYPQSNWKAEVDAKLGNLRLIARRQINSLLRRLEKTGKYQLYQEEIEKLISYEEEKGSKIRRGEEYD